MSTPNPESESRSVERKIETQALMACQVGHSHRSHFGEPQEGGEIAKELAHMSMGIAE